MSVRALSWSFSLPLKDMAAKGVLHALADHADEDWKCWPSLARIALFVGCSENTARRALQRVEAMGIVQRTDRPGQSDLYYLNADWHPSQIGTPPTVEPLPNEKLPLPRWDHTPPKLVGDPSHGGTRTTIEPSKNRQPNRQRGDDGRGTRLPDDWQPSADERGFASDLGMDPDATASSFRDYWVAVAGAKGRKADWPATWRNWCRRDAERRQPSGALGPLGQGKARRFQSPRGNDAFYEQLADIARRADD